MVFDHFLNFWKLVGLHEIHKWPHSYVVNQFWKIHNFFSGEISSMPFEHNMLLYHIHYVLKGHGGNSAGTWSNEVLKNSYFLTQYSVKRCTFFPVYYFLFCSLYRILLGWKMKNHVLRIAKKNICSLHQVFIKYFTTSTTNYDYKVEIFVNIYYHK